MVSLVDASILTGIRANLSCALCLSFGETDEFNIKATLYLTRHLIDVMYRRYKGMHLINPDSYLDPWDGAD